ncbi:MAG: hypothetical protein ABIU06_16915, partial [Anaerolineales bacterium]
IRKRAATKGDVVVEVKPGEEVVSVNVGWTVERFVEEQKEKPTKAASKRSSLNGKENGNRKEKGVTKLKQVVAKKAKSASKKAIKKAKPAKKKNK